MVHHPPFQCDGVWVKAHGIPGHTYPPHEDCVFVQQSLSDCQYGSVNYQDKDGNIHLHSDGSLKRFL